MNGQELKLKEAKILYDAEGSPEFVLLPFEQAKRLLQTQTSGTIYPLTDERVVAAVDEIRTELFEKQYARKVKSSA